MDNNAIISFLVCIICLFVFGKIFILPLKSILKLIANSCIGAAIIYIINLIGANFGFYIGINLGTAIFVGILGIPRSDIVGNFKIICNTLLKKVTETIYKMIFVTNFLAYSTVTDFARFLGLSTSNPLFLEI